jgi:hypothetical protein
LLCNVARNALFIRKLSVRVGGWPAC